MLNYHKYSAFTLIELLLVVAMSIILLALSIPSYQTHVMKSHREAAKVQLEQRKKQQERQSKLYEQGLISDQEMETTNSSYASALSSFNGIKL